MKLFNVATVHGAKRKEHTNKDFCIEDDVKDNIEIALEESGVEIEDCIVFRNDRHLRNLTFHYVPRSITSCLILL